MIALIDYGIGNLRSVEKALQAACARAGRDPALVRLVDTPAEILAAEKVVLPGVGAFGDGMRGLQQRSLVPALQAIAQRGTPLLGICLGMQLLFESSDEAPGVPGLGLLPGTVRRFTLPGLKVPQTGWNEILPARPAPLLAVDCPIYGRPWWPARLAARKQFLLPNFWPKEFCRAGRTVCLSPLKRRRKISAATCVPLAGISPPGKRPANGFLWMLLSWPMSSLWWRENTTSAP